MVPAKTHIWGLDRCCQVLPHRGWGSLHSHQQYAWASVCLTFIHMVLSEFLSVPIWKFNLHFPYYREVWAYFNGLKQYATYFLRTVCLYFCLFFFFFESNIGLFSYQFLGMQRVVSRFSCVLGWCMMLFLSRIKKIIFSLFLYLVSRSEMLFPFPFIRIILPQFPLLLSSFEFSL